MYLDVRVMIAPTAADGRQLAADLTARKVLFSTVEAEYGSVVVEGSYQTLAHHTGKWKENPAPCNWMHLPVQNEGVIIVSHIDLDTVGGVLALLGLKINNPEFWAAAEFIDLNGPHRIDEISELCRDQMNAFWAWKAGLQIGKFDEITDVTQLFHDCAGYLDLILLPEGREETNAKLISEGKAWAEKGKRKVEDCLAYEDESVRIFFTVGAFCSASYWSDKLEKHVPTTITLDTRSGAITLANRDGSVDCCAVMQAIFGEEAGGHKGIAGTPRSKRYDLTWVNAIWRYAHGDSFVVFP